MGEGRLIPVATEIFQRSIPVFVDKGIDLVIDTALHDQELLEYFYYVTAGSPVLLIGVHCPEDELVRREKERGDRQIGLSLQQLKVVRQQKEIYDVQVNSHESTLEECAKRDFA